MEQFAIEGGYPVSGEITPAGNKNAAQAVLAATLLTDEEIILNNVPEIGDIACIVEILQDLGVEVRSSGPRQLTVCARSVHKTRLRPDLSRKVRGSFLFSRCPFFGTVN